MSRRFFVGNLKVQGIFFQREPAWMVYIPRRKVRTCFSKERALNYFLRDVSLGVAETLLSKQRECDFTKETQFFFICRFSIEILMQISMRDARMVPSFRKFTRAPREPAAR